MSEHAAPDGPAKPAFKPIAIQKLKLNELLAIEGKVGRRISVELATFDLGMDTIIGLVWIAMRRENPDATFEEAGEVDFDTMMNAIEGPDEEPGPPPTPPLEQSGGTSSSDGDATSSPSRPPKRAPAPSSASSTP